MHRNKDVILGEDGYTNRCDNAPRNIFSLTGFVLKILKFVSHWGIRFNADTDSRARRTAIR
jgi:hypothetical protein